MDNIIIVGAGGFGREVYHWAKESFSSKKYRIKGFLDDDPNQLKNFNHKLRIIGSVLVEENCYAVKEGDKFLCAIGNIDNKKKAISVLKAKGAKFLSLIHPTAIVTETVKMGDGVIVCPFVTIADDVRVGDFSVLNFYSSCGHDAKVGNYCVLSPYATLNGFAALEDEVFLGTHSTVAANVKIGYRTKISANSAAMQDTTPHTFVYGVPGKNQIIFKDT